MIEVDGWKRVLFLSHRTMRPHHLQRQAGLYLSILLLDKRPNGNFNILELTNSIGFIELSKHSTIFDRGSNYD